MYFEEFKRAAYIERILAGLSHWLVTDGEDSQFHDNLLCWNDIWNSLHDIKHEYTLHILMLFEYR